jgi:hypothetical protein
MARARDTMVMDRVAFRPRGTAGLTRARRLALYTVGLGVWLSGALWLLFHYFLERPGPFGVSPHPLEPWWLWLHGACAFATIWTFGWLWSAHIRKGWGIGRKRPSGGLLVAILVGLTLTGHLLYYLSQEQARTITSFLHWSAGLACPIPFALHRLRNPASRRPLFVPAPRKRRPAVDPSAYGR